MYLEVTPEAEQTHQFLSYLVTLFASKRPFEVNKIIDIPILENSEKFPHISEIVKENSHRIIRHSIKAVVNRTMLFSYPKLGQSTTNEINDIVGRKNMRRVITIHYLLTLFLDELVYVSDMPDMHNPPSHIVSFKIKDVAKLESKIKKLADGQLKIKANKKKNKVIELYLKKDGHLCLMSNKARFYKMKPRMERYAIVKYFVEHEIYDYYPTSIVAKEFNKSVDNFVGEMGKINSMFRGAMETQDNLFEGESNSGYKINARYQIILEKE